MEKEFDKNFYGSSPPAIFIGSRLRYPEVNVGVMSLNEINERVWMFNSPEHWSKEKTPAQEIIELRKRLINSRVRTSVFDLRKESTFDEKKRILGVMQEIGMASLRADVEVELEKKPFFKLKLDKRDLPLALNAPLKKIKIVSNTKIPEKVESVYNDKDLKSAEAIKQLYDSGISDEHYLKQLLSVGVTGLAKNRKFVPTRNSITAVDDLIGKHILEQIEFYREIEDYLAYFGGHFGNYYLILLFPDVFRYELFEMSTLSKGENYSTDYENYTGRTKYASNTEGGYYAARLSILQHLHRIKRKASVLVLRFILPSYNIPLGVWVCRNSARKSLEEKPSVFGSRDEMLEYARDFVKRTFKFDVVKIFTSSKLLQEVKTQRKISEYF